MATASSSDVQDRLGRHLTEDEASQVETLLSDTEILIKAKIPDLDDKIADGDLDQSTVIMVEASAVARLMRNPDGYTTESDGTYSYQINWRLASGSLQITDHEWRLLGVSTGGVFVIHPRMRTWFQRYYDDAPAGHPFTWGG